MLSKQFIPHWQFNWFFKIKLLILQEPNKPLKLHTHVFLSKFISPSGLYLWCTVRLCMWLRYKALCATVFCFVFFFIKRRNSKFCFILFNWWILQFVKISIKSNVQQEVSTLWCSGKEIAWFQRNPHLNIWSMYRICQTCLRQTFHLSTPAMLE